MSNGSNETNLEILVRDLLGHQIFTAREIATREMQTALLAAQEAAMLNVQLVSQKLNERLDLRSDVDAALNEHLAEVAKRALADPAKKTAKPAQRSAARAPTPKLVPNAAIVSEPPKLAEFCLTSLLSERLADALIGDLNERFNRDCQQLGAARACRLYWARTLRSAWPLMRRYAARVVKWGFVLENVRRFFVGS